MLLERRCEGCGEPLSLAGPDSAGQLDPNARVHYHVENQYLAVLIIQCGRAKCRTINFLPLGEYVEVALKLPCRTHEIHGDLPEFLRLVAAEAGVRIDVIGEMVIGGQPCAAVLLFDQWDSFQWEEFLAAEAAGVEFFASAA